MLDTHISNTTCPRKIYRLLFISLSLYHIPVFKNNILSSCIYCDSPCATHVATLAYMWLLYLWLYLSFTVLSKIDTCTVHTIDEFCVYPMFVSIIMLFFFYPCSLLFIRRESVSIYIRFLLSDHLASFSYGNQTTHRRVLVRWHGWSLDGIVGSYLLLHGRRLGEHWHRRKQTV